MDIEDYELKRRRLEAAEILTSLKLGALPAVTPKHPTFLEPNQHLGGLNYDANLLTKYYQQITKLSLNGSTALNGPRAPTPSLPTVGGAFTLGKPIIPPPLSFKTANTEAAASSQLAIKQSAPVTSNNNNKLRDDTTTLSAKTPTSSSDASTPVHEPYKKHLLHKARGENGAASAAAAAAAEQKSPSAGASVVSQRNFSNSSSPATTDSGSETVTASSSSGKKSIPLEEMSLDQLLKHCIVNEDHWKLIRRRIAENQQFFENRIDQLSAENRLFQQEIAILRSQRQLELTSAFRALPPAPQWSTAPLGGATASSLYLKDPSPSLLHAALLERAQLLARC